MLKIYVKFNLERDGIMIKVIFDKDYTKADIEEKENILYIKLLSLSYVINLLK